MNEISQEDKFRQHILKLLVEEIQGSSSVNKDECTDPSSMGNMECTTMNKNGHTPRESPNREPEDDMPEDDLEMLLTAVEELDALDKDEIQYEQNAESPVACIPEHKIIPEVEANSGDGEAKEFLEAEIFRDKIRKLLMDELQESPSNNLRPIGCNVCNTNNHQLKDCYRRICTHCKMKGHSSEDCPIKDCTICNVRDHRIRDCPRRICSHCKLKGHDVIDCPNKDHTPSRWSHYTTRKEHRRSPDVRYTKQDDLELLPKATEKRKSVEDDEQFKQSIEIAADSIPEKKIRSLVEAGAECIVCKGDHWVQHCPKRMCSYCLLDGHDSMNCPNKEYSSSKRKGHTSKKYPNKGPGDRYRQQDDLELLVLAREKRKSVEDEKQLKQNIESEVECIPENKIRLTAAEADTGCFLCKTSDHEFNCCPRRICSNCRTKGHSSIDCPVKGCGICMTTDHEIRYCPERICSYCQLKGHASRDCTSRVGCPKCKQRHHPSEDCPAEGCNVCKVTDHVRSNCPNRMCRHCKMNGHDSWNCHNKMCDKCNQRHNPCEDCPDLESSSWSRAPTKRKFAYKVCDKCKQRHNPSEECTDSECNVCLTKYYHWKRLCPNRICGCCNQKGHGRVDCPNKSSMLELTLNQIKSKELFQQMKERSERSRSRSLSPQQAPEDSDSVYSTQPSAEASNLCLACNEEGHNSKDCPKLYCSNCKKTGHLIRNCPDIYCPHCRRNGHIGMDCPETVCHNCKKPYHARKDCPYKECDYCKKKGHVARTCPETVCVRCKQMGHTILQCHIKVCPRCREVGHTVKDCRAPVTGCKKCHDPEHRIRDCPKAVCPRCTEIGHTAMDCTSKGCPYCKQFGHSKMECLTKGSVPPSLNNQSSTIKQGKVLTPTDTIYVSNLPAGCTAGLLENKCKSIGQVIYVAIMGFNLGIVQYKHISMAEEAVSSLNLTEFEESTISVGFFESDNSKRTHCK